MQASQRFSVSEIGTQTSDPIIAHFRDGLKKFNRQ